MNTYLKKQNVRFSLEEIIHNNTLTDINLDEFAAEVYAYALKCKTEKCFTEKESIMLIKKYAKVSREVLIEFWSVVVMYCLENLSNKLVNYFAKDADCMEEMKSIAMYTLFDCAKHYDFNNEYRRMYEASIEEMTIDLAPKASKFMTYATNSEVNNLRRFNRERFPIHIPDKKARLFAFVASILEKEKGDVTAEYMAELIRQNANALNIHVPKNDKKFEMFVWNIMDVCNTNGACQSGIDDEFELYLIKDEEYNPEHLVVEAESESAIEKAFPQITAEIYGYDSAYVTYMRSKGLSFSKMVQPFRTFKMISQYLDDVACENGELLQLINKIKLDVCTYGLNGAVARQTNFIAAQHLASAITHAKALTEEIERGERTVEECIGKKYEKGSLTYIFNRIFPVNSSWNDNDRTKSKFYRRALRHAGLDAIATAIEARI